MRGEHPNSNRENNNNREKQLEAKRERIINSILFFTTPLSSYILYQNSVGFTKIPFYCNSLTLTGITPLLVYSLLSFATAGVDVEDKPCLKSIAQTSSVIANYTVLSYAASSLLPIEEYKSTVGTFLSYGALASSLFLDRMIRARYISSSNEKHSLKQDLLGLFVVLLISGGFAGIHVSAERACIAMLPELKEYGIGSVCGVTTSVVLLKIINQFLPKNLEQEQQNIR